jgi:hypothetical protein
MSIFGKIFDIFGQGDKKFYARDFRNAYQFRPDVNPPRQQFQGYVNFVMNRDLYEIFFTEQGQEFRVQISSLVRRASMPSVNLKTETKNQYNRKKIVNITSEFQPVNITVMDTVGNEWLTLLMKYYTYHYMNARNEGSGTRDVGRSPDYVTESDFSNSIFGLDGGWNSNKMGYNVNITPYFFERIDYVLYHGNKGVQYSLLNPVLTSFKTSDLDYSENGLMNFDLTFEYENFTVFNEVNFALSNFDVARFERADKFTGAAFSEGNKAIALKYDPVKLGILGTSQSARARSAQPQPPAAPIEEASRVSLTPAEAELRRLQAERELILAERARLQADGAIILDPVVVLGTRPLTQVETVVDQKTSFPSTYGPAATFASGSNLGKPSFLEGLIGNVADNALSAAINGTSIKDASLGAVVGGVLNEIEPRIRPIGQPATRGTRPTITEPITAATEKPPQTPDGGG